MARKNVIEIDSTKGGNGDIWMRLVSFYSVSAMLPKVEFRIIVPSFFVNIAKYSFGDRLTIQTEGTPQRLTYTSYGLKDLIIPLLSGRRFISPYQRAVFRDKRRRQFKDYVNSALFTIADTLGLIQVPAWKWIDLYQGYLDIIGIRRLKEIGYDKYTEQLKADYNIIYDRLSQDLPTSSELIIPQDLNKNILIYPTGTSRQFVPVWWAKKNMPDAYYAFFHKDESALEFVNAGLKVVYFFREPGDIIKLSAEASWSISTDSFPSHLLQYTSTRCTITITEVLRSRIISPVFRGKVVDAVAPCHPCLHLDRSNHPTCSAGFRECINWKDDIYTSNVKNHLMTTY